jgi:hypothetical protein
MAPFGSDRVRVDGERIALSSRLPKGWTPRVARTLTSAEFPGTAVLWEERYFEVVGAEALPQGAVRYTLEPWPDHHAMRVTARYDAESEAALAAEWRAARVHEQKRTTVNALALLTGHLPAVVQDRFGAELGVLPARLTMLSLLSELALMAMIVCYAVSSYMDRGGVPSWTMPVTLYLLLESAIRFLICWTQHRPVGSALGGIAYIFHWILSGARAEASPFATARGHTAPLRTAVPEERRQSDAFLLREPLATLLPATDQWRLRERYGYDYRRLSGKVAAFLFAVAVLGIVSALRMGAIVSGGVAALLAVEQLIRLAAFTRGPQPSVLGWIARPLLSKLL